jgi:aryl-alcohol dehydrogenase-like predicted oxidoreductase
MEYRRFGSTGLAWIIYNKEVSTAITGARSLEQLNDSIGALDIFKKWTPELDQRVNKLLDNTPKPKMDYKTFTPRTPRRP